MTLAASVSTKTGEFSTETLQRIGEIHVRALTEMSDLQVEFMVLGAEASLAPVRQFGELLNGSSKDGETGLHVYAGRFLELTDRAGGLWMETGTAMLSVLEGIFSTARAGIDEVAVAAPVTTGARTRTSKKTGATGKVGAKPVSKAAKKRKKA